MNQSFSSAETFGATKLTASDLGVGQIVVIFSTDYNGIVDEFTILGDYVIERLNEGDPKPTLIFPARNNRTGRETRLSVVMMGMTDYPLDEYNPFSDKDNHLLRTVATLARGRFTVDASERHLLPQAPPTFAPEDLDFGEAEEDEEEED